MKLYPKSKGDSLETPFHILEMARNLPGTYCELSMFDPCPINGEGGLEKEWKGQTFVNPPFSNILPWVEKALGSHGPIIMLLPVRSTKDWFHLLLESPRVDFHWLRKRIRFSGMKTNPPFDCFLVVIREREIEAQ
jgi:hypothetical protein